MKPSLALFASTALVLGGCASQETTLETEQAYQVDWVGAQPTMDYSHISLTFLVLLSVLLFCFFGLLFVLF